MSWNTVQIEIASAENRKSYFGDCHHWRDEWIYM